MNEFEAHIKEHEPEYRWLAKYYKMEYDDLIQQAPYDANMRKTVSLLKQYHYDQCHE